MQILHFAQFESLITKMAEIIFESENESEKNVIFSRDSDQINDLARGFRILFNTLRIQKASSISQLFSLAGNCLLENVRNIIGVTIANIFLGMAEPVKTKDYIDLHMFTEMVSYGSLKLKDLQNQDLGYKASIEAISLAEKSLIHSCAENEELNIAINKALLAAKNNESQSDVPANSEIAEYQRETGASSAGITMNPVYLLFLSLVKVLSHQLIEAHESEEDWVFVYKQISITISKINYFFVFRFQSNQKLIELRQSEEIKFLGRDSHLWLSLKTISRIQVTNNSIEFSAILADSINVQFDLSFPLDQVCQIHVSPQSANSFEAIRISFHGDPEEHFYGGGERFASVDLRGQHIMFKVEDHSLPPYNRTYFPIPFILSNKGYAFWINSTFTSCMDFFLERADQIILESETEDLIFEIIFGPDPLQMIDLFTFQTGRPIIPPSWNWGFWHVCLGGEHAVLAEARKMRDLHIPCTALWVYDAFDPMGSIGWPIDPMHHSGHYPDIRRLVSDLHAMGYKVQTYLFPYFYQESPLFSKADAEGFFLRNMDGSTYIFDMWSVDGRNAIKKPAAMFDFTNPDAKEWWHALIKYIVIDLGFDGWMQDFGEYTPDEVIGYDGRSGKELHNAYPVLYQKTTREACDKVKEGVSFYARSGFTGSQQWLTAAWNGDQAVNWDHEIGYPSTISACLSLSLSGMPYVGPDIGGYFGRSKQFTLKCESKELWIRWVQFSAFTTLMRDHSGDKPDTAIGLWEDEETVKILTFYSRLHMALTPFWEIYANDASRSGAPIMRHLYLVAPNDPRTWNCEDEYLLGEEILVAPVISDGARERKVYLPAGNWVDYWESTIYAGGSEVTVPCPLDRIPLFVRSGSLIPTLLDPGDTLVDSNNPDVLVAKNDLEIRLFLPDFWWGSPDNSGESQILLTDETQVKVIWSASSITFDILGSKEREYCLTFPYHKKPNTVLLKGKNSQKDSVLNNGMGYSIDHLSETNRVFFRIRCRETSVQLSL